MLEEGDAENCGGSDTYEKSVSRLRKKVRR